MVQERSPSNDALIFNRRTIVTPPWKEFCRARPAVKHQMRVPAYYLGYVKIFNSATWFFIDEDNSERRFVGASV